MSRLLGVIGRDISVVFCSVHLKHTVILAFKRAGISIQCPIITIDDNKEAYDVTVAQNQSANEDEDELSESEYSVIPFGGILQTRKHGLKGLLRSSSFGRHLMFPLCRRGPDDIDVLLPTSGSTGTVPKLAVIRDSRLCQLCQSGRDSSSSQMTILAYRLLRQSVDTFCKGGAIGVFSGSLSRVLEDAKVLRPTLFAAVPSFWNGLYQQYIEEKRHNGYDDDEAYEVWHNRMVFGNRIRTLLTTGAPLCEDTSEWLSRTFGVPLLNGYGCTECGGLMSNGIMKSGVDIRLLDRPDIGYTTADKPYPRGEIVASSPGMITGYFKNDEATQNSFVTLSDGKTYFRTGDLGVMREGGSVVVVGRTNSVTKLAHGVYICAEGLETLYSAECGDLISQLFIYGSHSLSSVGAVVVSSLGSTDGFLDLIRKRFRIVAAKAGLSPWEVPGRIIIESEPFSIENGLISAAGKIHRPSLTKKYAPFFENSSMPQDDVIDCVSARSFTPFRIGDLSLGFCDIVSNVLGPFNYNDNGSITPEMSVFELGADSLKVTQLSMLLQERFGKPVPVAVIVKLPVLRDLHGYVFQGSESSQAALENKASQLAKQLKQDFERLWCEIEGCSWVYPRSEAKSHCVLLSGATGFLGIHVLAELLSQATATAGLRIKCLVRRKGDSQDVVERLKSVCRHFHVVLDESCVDVFEGDVSKERFGLTVEEYDDLIKTVDGIIHCAATIISAAPYRSHYQANVKGTHNILKFASVAHAILVYVSTMGIASGKLENDTAEHVASLSGYAQSKWVAESLVRRAIDKGLHGIIVRSPVLIADKQWNVCNESDATVLLVRGLKRLGCINIGKQLPQQYRFMHVDDVAMVVVRFWLALMNDQLPSVSHKLLCCLIGTTFSLTEFAEAVIDSSTSQQIIIRDDVEFVKMVNDTVTDGKHPLALFKGAIINGFPSVEHVEESSVDDSTSTLLENIGLKAEIVLHSVSKESLTEALKHI